MLSPPIESKDSQKLVDALHLIFLCVLVLPNEKAGVRWILREISMTARNWAVTRTPGTCATHRRLAKRKLHRHRQ